MPEALTHGTPKSGYAEIIRNARGVDPIAFEAKENLANASGVEEFNEGEWSILDADGLVNVSDSGNAEVAAWPNIIGKERSDVYGSGTTTLIIGSGYHMNTSAYDDTVAAENYAYGTLLAVKNGKLTPAVSGEAVLAMVLKGVHVIQKDAEKALNKPGFTVIQVEVGPRGIAP